MTDEFAAVFVRTRINTHARTQFKGGTQRDESMQTWTLTATSMSAGRHGGQAIGLSCYWRRLFSWATNKELPFSPRIALSAPCLMKWRTRMRITWSVTQCELAEFVRERECVSTCIGVAFMHNHASVMMFNRKLKISRRARAIFAPQNCWL